MAAGTTGLLGYTLASRKLVQAAEPVRDPVYRTRITHADRMAAAERIGELAESAGLKAPDGGSTFFGQAFPLAANPGPGDVPDYFSITVPNWAYSPPIRKFVDRLPGLGAGNANLLGQYIPVANPDKLTYPGSDYYEISLREYNEKLHSDLPATRLRGYVQTNTGTNAGGTANDVPPDPIHYLGPLIIAQKDRAVRIRFTNELLTGPGGNLFIPVDEAMMGAGLGPMGGTEKYTQNRAVIHLHGADAPWISDGTPHQWITPAGETTSYPDGSSVLYSGVPDMPNPGPGQYNYYYPNQISARLMFYHDHALGITRLNVYVGMAAGYIIRDPVEKELVDTGKIPADEIPLIVQDKTFVDAPMIPSTDPTWNWGVTPGTPHDGDLWMGHVYNPAANPWNPDGSGVNPMGRWLYAPWFWPPATNLVVGPLTNPYYDPVNAPWEAPYIPGTPHPAMQMESFQDTMLVNGTAFPYVEVDPKAYRLRVLNACNDRFVNLQMYEADPAGYAIDATGAPVAPGTGFGTEVKTVEAAPYRTDPTWPQDFTEGNGTWPVDGRDGGVPDWNTSGPDWIVIGSEGGFLPAPAVVRQRPIDWNVDVTTFNAGIVNSFSLLLGPAERSDAIVDFSAFRGKTLIVYNDAPAPFPAPDPRLDYFTGSEDMAEAGGYTYPANENTTLPGRGPNTRTVMQIRVRDIAPALPFSVTALNEAWESNAAHQGVFERTQPKVIVPNSRYNSAYRVDNGDGTFSPRTGLTSFPTPSETYVRIFQNSHTFRTISGLQLTMPLQPKAIQDEMGEAFDPIYGRMSGMLGLELPNTQVGAANFMLYPYASPPVEVLRDSMIPLSEPAPGDGTQLWKITHNGVDTHPIHFHLFNVQLINRVAWDGGISFPHPTELGWKETLRVSPLEDTIVAMRPVAPQLPFKVPNSIRPIDTTMPLGEELMGPPGGFFDPNGNPITIVNQMVNFGWEYVLHCHILGHEEMDMMHGVCFAVAPDAPSGLTATGLSNPLRVSLTWVDNSANATGFKLERATDPAFTSNLVTINLPRVTSYIDGSVESGWFYYYRIQATNTVGSTVPGFPNVTATSLVTTAVPGLAGAIGRLRVQTNPAVSTTIFLNGIQHNDWALNWVKLPAGSYNLSFSDVFAYGTPTSVSVKYYPGGNAVTQSLNDPINVLPDTVTEVIAEFAQLGNLRVETSPPVPATIFCNGLPMDEWSFWATMEPGAYAISFQDLDGYITPDPQNVTVSPGATTHVIGQYVPGANTVTPPVVGLLRVQTEPPSQTRVFVDDIPRNDWGLSWVKMPAGNYRLSFSDVFAKQTPTSVSVRYFPGGDPVTQSLDDPIMIANDTVTEVIATFSSRGNLRVETSPPVEATIFCNGVPMDDWGLWTNLIPGSYTVSFQPVSGFMTPPPVTVTINPSNETVHIIGNYSTGQTQVI